MKLHSERSKSCYACIKQNLACPHPLPTMREKIAEMKRKQTLKPFFIVITLFFLMHMTGIYPQRPYLVQIFKAFESPIPADKSVVIVSVLDNLALITFMCLVRFTGKRRIYLTMLFGIFLCTLVISVYGFIVLPIGSTSFNLSTQSNFQLDNKKLGYIPMIVCFYHFRVFCY